MNNIQIYGPGCAKCASLAEVAQQAVKELQWNIPVEKVSDPMLFAVAGVFVTPALVVNGKVLLSGKVPTVDALSKLLIEAAEPHSDGAACCCGGNQKTPVQESACGCENGKGCCGDADRSRGGWKKFAVWLVVLVVILAAVKLLNHRSKAPEETRLSPSALPAQNSEKPLLPKGVQAS